MKAFRVVSLACSIQALLSFHCFSQPEIATTHINSGTPVNDALATTQSLKAPFAVASDGVGGLYVSDINRIYHMAADGQLRLVAGSGTTGYSGDGGYATFAQLNSPRGVAVDSAGTLYIADSLNNRIRKVTLAGVITTVAGNGKRGFDVDRISIGDGGNATFAQLNSPRGVSVDSAGNLYIADYGNGRIRKITPDGVITTIAGNGSPGSNGDGGQAIYAQIGLPNSVAVDSSGNLFMSDNMNYCIRKVTLDGVISTVAGNGKHGYSGDGGEATSAQLDRPEGVAVDFSGNVYIADLWNCRIRKVTPDGIITTIAGNGTRGSIGDGGLAALAQLDRPMGVAVDSARDIYIADTFNHCIRKVTLDGVIATVAGNATRGPMGDGGQAISAQLWNPQGVIVDSTGNLYIADTDNRRVRKVTPNGVITTVAGNGSYGSSGDGGQATSAQLTPNAIAIDSAGNLYIADTWNHRIRKVTPAGVITTVAGNGIIGNRRNDDNTNYEQLNLPSGVAVDSTGNLYIADTNDCRIRKVTPDGVVTIISDNAPSGLLEIGPLGQSSASRLAVDTADNLYIADNDKNRIRKMTPAGMIDTLPGKMKENCMIESRYGSCEKVDLFQLISPLGGLAVDTAGNLYIANNWNNRIFKFAPTGVITTVAGTGEKGFNGDGGNATSALLDNPMGVTVDSAGNLYIADTGNGRIRKVTTAGVITTVAGN
jgi:trimeric autotransporter adhesin